MATVSVPVEAFRVGMFPRMCAKTGWPAPELVAVAARFTPGRLAALGQVLFPLAPQPALHGRLPYAPAVAHRRRRGIVVGRMGLVAALAGTFAVRAAPAVGIPLLVASVVVALWGLYLSLRATVRAQVVADGSTVRLYGVATAFAEAVRAQGLAVDR